MSTYLTEQKSLIGTPEALATSLFAAQKRIPELDGLRGLAIALVNAYHYVDVNIFGNKFLSYLLLPAHLGWSGVDLFFVLSGLLIGGILMPVADSEGILYDEISSIARSPFILRLFISYSCA